MEKREFWKKHIKAQRESGLSQAKYCRERGLALSSFGNWSLRISREQRSGVEPGRFVPVNPTAPIEIIVGKVTVRVPQGSDAGEIRRIVEALSC